MDHAELLELAKTAYGVHRIATGGADTLADGGTLLPSWDDLSEGKRSAWVQAADEAAAEFLAEKAGG